MHYLTAKRIPYQIQSHYIRWISGNSNRSMIPFETSFQLISFFQYFHSIKFYYKFRSLCLVCCNSYTPNNGIPFRAPGFPSETYFTLFQHHRCSGHAQAWGVRHLPFLHLSFPNVWVEIPYMSLEPPFQGGTGAFLARLLAESSRWLILCRPPWLTKSSIFLWKPFWKDIYIISNPHQTQRHGIHSGRSNSSSPT